MVISVEGRKYRQRVKELLLPAFEGVPNYSTALQVWVEVMFPDRRKRDLDNLNKALLDSLTHSSVWDDDSLIHDLRLVRIGVEKPGFVRLHVAEITNMDALLADMRSTSGCSTVGEIPCFGDTK